MAGKGSAARDDAPTVRVRFFGRLKETAGAGTRELRLPGDGATVADAVARLREAGALEDPDRVAYSVGDVLVDADHPLEDGDELGLLPPVSGG